MSDSGLQMSRRIRRTPYMDRVETAGVRGYSVVNHMLLPKAFQPSVEDDYWHLREHAQIWDVSTQRQVELHGPDAARLTQWMTPRDLSRMAVGQCYYVPLVDQNGGMINDPVLLKLAEGRFWLSIADSDVLLWANGLALGAGMDVQVSEPDVSPLAIQGPKAEDLLADIFGDAIRKIKFFRFGYVEFKGTQQVIARSGYSRQGGFEIYLQGSELGSELWDTIWDAGQKYDIRPGCPNLIERIEGGLLSYGNEMTRENNPLECGLTDYCDLDSNVDFIGKEALHRIHASGVERQMRGIRFDGGRAPVCSVPWPVLDNQGRQVGQITSGIWSPRLDCNVGLSMIETPTNTPGQPVTVVTSDGAHRPGKVRALPFD